MMPLLGHLVDVPRVCWAPGSVPKLHGPPLRGCQSDRRGRRGIVPGMRGPGLVCRIGRPCWALGLAGRAKALLVQGMEEARRGFSPRASRGSQALPP